MEWGSVISGGLQAGATITTGIMNWDEAKRMRKIAQGQLDETKKMNQWEMDKYKDTLKNQGEAMSTLGESFGKALQNESSTQNAQNSPSASNQNTSADSATSAQNSQAQENEPLLPTQRY